MLSQWRGYGHDGVAIVFNKYKLEGLLLKEQNQYQLYPCSLERAVYDECECNLVSRFPCLFEKLMKYAGEYAARLNMENESIQTAMMELNTELFIAAGRLKHRGFEEENEYRIIFGISQNSSIEKFSHRPINLSCL